LDNIKVACDLPYVEIKSAPTKLAKNEVAVLWLSVKFPETLNVSPTLTFAFTCFKVLP
jgi:hypothetical protein